jgi:large subunit ribosomal protein L21
MANAVIRTGGKQYQVKEGDVLRVEKLAGEPGSTITFDEVLMVGGDKPKFGQPLVSGAQVKAEIVAQDRAAKIIVFKFKRRKKHRKKQGHRQYFTQVKITGVKA